MNIARDALTQEPLLTAGEQTDLARQIEAGLFAREALEDGRSRVGGTEEELLALEELGERARQRYIRANLRLVAKIARQAAVRTRLPEGDLFQEGCLGLICAVERFDHRRGYRFSTYASFWVRAYVGAATASSLGALNVSSSRAQQLRGARGVEVDLTQSLGRAPALSEVAAALGRSEKWTAELLAHRPPQSLDGLDGDAADVAADSGGWGDVSLEHDRPGAELLCHLQGLERDVLALRCGFVGERVHSYAEISRLLTISVSRARRLERRALDALRAICPSGAAAHL